MSRQNHPVSLLWLCSGAAAAFNARGGSEDKDKVLAEKDAELRRMQEMLAKMQEQMKQQRETRKSVLKTEAELKKMTESFMEVQASAQLQQLQKQP